MLSRTLPMLFQRNAAALRAPIAATPRMLPLLTPARGKSMAAQRRQRPQRGAFDKVLSLEGSTPFLLRDAVRDADRTMDQLESFVNSVTGSLLAEPPLSLASAFPNRDMSVLRPSFEWEETDSGFSLIAATPGLAKEDLSVEIVRGDATAAREQGLYLVISGGAKPEPTAEQPGENATDKPAESAEEPASASKGTGRSARGRFARFEHRMRLPANVDEESLTAKYENGLLEVHMRWRAEEAQEHRTKIDIK